MYKKHRATIKQGKVVYHSLPEWERNLQGLEGKEVEVTVREWKKKRSNNQNRYYWGVVLKLLSDYSGHTVEEMHEIMKQKFLGQKGIEFEGDIFLSSLTTKKLKTNEFEEYLAQIRRFASGLGVQIPEPNEVEY